MSNARGPKDLLTFDRAVPGTNTMTADSTTSYRGATQRITVVSGQTVSITIALEPAGRLVIPIDRYNGSVPSVCAYVAHERLGVPESSGCNFSSTLLVIDAVPVGPVQLFVVPENNGGAQWLGASGGTGVRQLAAARVGAPGRDDHSPAGSTGTARRHLGLGARVRRDAAPVHGAVRTVPGIGWLRPVDNPVQ